MNQCENGAHCLYCKFYQLISETSESEIDQSSDISFNQLDNQSFFNNNEEYLKLKNYFKELKL